MQVNCSFKKMVPIEAIVAHESNPNKHPDKQIEMLARIMNYQGWRHPIVISNLSGKCVAGHGRLAAAKLNGWTEVPTDTQDFENKAQEIAFLISDNKIAELANTDDEQMIELIRSTDIDDLELFGLDDFVLPEDDAKEREAMEDEVPDVTQSISKLGDIYELGNHRLCCGDSTSSDTLSLLMDGTKADMVFTDPPYGMDLDTDYKGALGDSGFREAKSYKKVQGDDDEFNFNEAYALVESVKEQIWFGADYYYEQLLKCGSWYVWNKRTSESLEKMYGNHFELAWSKQKHKREIAHVAWAGAFGHNKKDDGPKKVHPTMKAIKLIEWFFERIEGHTVLDLFGGSGSTLIACEKTNRKCFMMELDPHYIDVIVTRWCKYTNTVNIKRNGEPMEWTIGQT